MSTASTCSIEIGNPDVVRLKPEAFRSQTDFDRLRQKIRVHHISDLDTARNAANANIGSPSFNEANFYVTGAREKFLPDLDGWEFDVEFGGTFDPNRRHRLSVTTHENITWSTGDTRYEILLPRMTIVDLWFSQGAPNWAQQGTTVNPVNPPVPPTIPSFTSTSFVYHVPFGWVLTSRESDFVGPFPGQIHAVTDTITYFEQIRPGSF